MKSELPKTTDIFLFRSPQNLYYKQFLMCYIFNVVRSYTSLTSESQMSLSHFQVNDAVFLRFTNSGCIFEKFSCACALFNNFQTLSMIYRSPTSTILNAKNS